MFLMQVMRLAGDAVSNTLAQFGMLLQLVLQPHSITATSVFCLLVDSQLGDCFKALSKRGLFLCQIFWL